MRFKLYKAGVLSLLAALAGICAFFGWPLYLKRAEDTTLASVARHSQEITAVEVLRLTERGSVGPAGSYDLGYNRSRRGIAERAMLAGAQASTLVKHWGEIRFATLLMAGCHEPGFVLRFLTGHRCVLEVAVCFDCENVSWSSAPFTTSCRQMLPPALGGNSGIEGLKTYLTQLP